MFLSNPALLTFLKANQYTHPNNYTCDFSNIPRAHFSLGLLLDGMGVFSQNGKQDVVVRPGEIIFVPMTSRYISRWYGRPSVSYVSLHFAFAPSVSGSSKFKLQTVIPTNVSNMKNNFLYILNHQDTADLSINYANLSRFYQVMSDVVPLLIRDDDGAYDERIDKALQYINLHSEQNLSIPELASSFHMGESNFYTLFKKYTGTTPIEYRNAIRIRTAMQMLNADRGISIEELSSLLGFTSATYFRRIFKKTTQQTPREYRKSKIEL